MKVRAKNTHPTHQKLDKLMAYAEELGIRINFDAYGTTVVDSDLPTLEWDLHDLEEESYNHSQITTIPYGLEFKLIREVEEIGE